MCTYIYIHTHTLLHQFYYLFGFLFLVLVILLLTCAEVTILPLIPEEAATNTLRGSY
jgi:hypothetical protein